MNSNSTMTVDKDCSINCGVKVIEVPCDYNPTTLSVEKKVLNPKGGNDKVYTPDYLAKYIVEYFKPTGRILEPSSGNGVFLKYIDADWYEIDKGKDFFDCNETYDWAITNPPFSKIRKFLQHLYKLKVKNIVFLCPTNHILGLKARLKDMSDNGYGIKEIILIDTPKEFPQSGFQWSINYIRLNYKGDIRYGYTKRR